MGFYQNRVVPILIDLSMRNHILRPYRQRVVGAAEGRVLEVGIGSGENLAFYSPRVEHILGLDPSSQLLKRARKRAEIARRRVELVEASAQSIPLSDHSVDTVLMTWVGCSLPDANVALGEIRRVLKPGGRLLFVEHGRAPEPQVARWQDRINPFWRRVSGGCNLNRKIDDVIAQAGFRIDHLETGYIAGPKIMTFLYEGAAAPR
jgi:ubiquinone/menaquinone biosynthesis C-methylase UbiE